MRHLLMLASEGGGATLGDAIRENPYFIVLNIIVSAIVVAIVIERVLFQVRRYGVNAKEFFGQVKKLVVAGNIDRAIKLCEAGDFPVFRVFRAGLTNINRGEEAVISAIEENMMDVEPTVEKRINSLWSLANIATLFGLLGTILGLIHTFGALDRVTDPGARQQALARGISEAMNNTALGLGIAVACMVAHLLLSEWKKRILGDLELNVSKLQNLLTIGRPQG